MEAPCDFKTPTLCRYVNRAVEYELTRGSVSRIHIHRYERPVPSAPKPSAAGEPIAPIAPTTSSAESTFGPFNGQLQKDARFGMHRHIVLETMGPPSRAEPVEDNPNHTVERHHYPGLVLEYDLLPNGNTVLGGIIVERSNEAAAPSSAAPKR